MRVVESFLNGDASQHWIDSSFLKLGQYLLNM